MFAAKIDTRVLRDPSWWHWAVTVPLLAGQLLDLPGCLAIATLVCLAMAGYFWLQVRGLHPMPVQVRLVYAAMLVIGTLPWMGWIHVVQFVGTSLMVLVGYCPLVRLLTLLPANRSQPLSREFLKRLAFEPAAGGLVDISRGEAAVPGSCSCSCSVATGVQRMKAPAAFPPSPLHVR